MAYTPFTGVDVPGPPRDLVGYGRKVPKVRWPDDARVAVSIVLNYEEGSEYCHPNGDRRNDGLTEMIYAIDARSTATSAPNRSSSTARAQGSGESSACSPS